jgi:hypothetical protein
VAASHHGDTPYSGNLVTSVPVTPYTTSVDVNLCPGRVHLARLPVTVRDGGLRRPGAMTPAHEISPHRPQDGYQGQASFKARLLLWAA